VVVRRESPARLLAEITARFAFKNTRGGALGNEGAMPGLKGQAQIAKVAPFMVRHITILKGDPDYDRMEGRNDFPTDL
jgi:hypothetical protein